MVNIFKKLFKKKPTIYVVHGGYIVSKNDGDEHYVSAYDLVRLYGLTKKHNYITIDIMDNQDRIKGLKGNIVHLYPRFDGLYKEVK